MKTFCQRHITNHRGENEEEKKLKHIYMKPHPVFTYHILHTRRPWPRYARTIYKLPLPTGKCHRKMTNLAGRAVLSV